MSKEFCFICKGDNIIIARDMVGTRKCGTCGNHWVPSEWRPSTDTDIAFATMNTQDEMLEVSQKIAQAQQDSILEQLSFFVERGLITLELGQLVMTRSTDLSLKVSQRVHLKLNNHEYVEKLERENKEYKEIIDRLKAAI
nr:hypothetical protein BHI3_07500 [Bacteriovorax sp. HI3]